MQPLLSLPKPRPRHESGEPHSFSWLETTPRRTRRYPPTPTLKPSELQKGWSDGDDTSERQPLRLAAVAREAPAKMSRSDVPVVPTTSARVAAPSTNTTRRLAKLWFRKPWNFASTRSRLALPVL